MRTLTIFIILVLTMTGFSSCKNKEAEKSGLIAGTENPGIKKCKDGTAYIYKEYEIKVEPSPEQEGMDIFLYAPEISGGNPCDMQKRNATHIISTGETQGNNFFSGIYKNYLFINQGTGPDGRTLSVYDLKQKKLILFTEYSEPELHDGVLTYYKVIAPDPAVIENIACPEVSKWEEQGLTVLYEQKEKFTLDTETKLTLDEFRCREGQ